MTAGPQPFYKGDRVVFHHDLLDREFTGVITNVTKRRIQLTIDNPPDNILAVRSFTWAQAANQLRYDFMVGDDVQ